MHEVYNEVFFNCGSDFPPVDIMKCQENIFTFLLYYHRFLLNLFGLWVPSANSFVLIHFVYSVSLISSICIGSLCNAYHMFKASAQHPLPTTNIFTSHQIILYALLVMLLCISQLGYGREHSDLLGTAGKLFADIWNRFPSDRINVPILLFQFGVGSIVVNLMKIIITTSNTFHTVVADNAVPQEPTVYIHLILTNVMYLIISTFENHFYAVIMLLVFQYRIVNDRIERITEMAESIQSAMDTSIGERPYKAMAAFCRLSDELNEMAALHDRITTVTKRFSHLYRFQIVLLVTWKFYLFISQTYQEYLVVTSFITERRSGYQQLIERLLLWMLNFVGIYLISHVSTQIQNEVRLKLS